jgi:hypothetical protein
MILIAHRGNINGPICSEENKPNYIIAAIEKNFNVEIDVWVKDQQIYLGHDEPQYIITKSFLEEYNNFLWCHAKNYSALNFLLENNFHCFWHQEDKYTITSKGYVWCYPNSILPKRSICLFPDITKQEYKEAVGICSDFIVNYKL